MGSGAEPCRRVRDDTQEPVDGCTLRMRTDRGASRPRLRLRTQCRQPPPEGVAQARATSARGGRVRAARAVHHRRRGRRVAAARHGPKALDQIRRALAARQEDGNAAREQERRGLQRGWGHRWRGGPRVRSRGGQGLPRRSNPGEPRRGGRADPLRGKRGRDRSDRCPRRDGGRRTRRHSLPLFYKFMSRSMPLSPRARKLW